jgi:hypothetical protein
LVRGFPEGWLHLENLKVLPDLTHRWPWQKSKGEQDALSHVEFLLIWGRLGKRRNLCKVTNFPLLPFLDGKSSLKDPGRIPPFLLIKTLERS